MSALTYLRSPTWNDRKPTLSVLIPFYKDSPCDLLTSLDKQVFHSPQAKQSVEVLVYDDGTNDPFLSDDIKRTLSNRDIAITCISNSRNQGRAAARNALQDAARADWVLFLDADMRPVNNDFLQNYLNIIKTGDADVIFGGFTVESKSRDPERELHRALSAVSDCLPLDVRKAKGPQFVATSNLCVRKSTLQSEPFDTGFSGWGWEDSEWAARITKSYHLEHIDNPALHLGLETNDTLLDRFASSGQNYVRFTRKHPELAKTLTLYRLSKGLGKLPLQSQLRPLYRFMVKSKITPLKLRLLGLKLWRASHYAEAMQACPAPLQEAKI